MTNVTAFKRDDTVYRTEVWDGEHLVTYFLSNQREEVEESATILVEKLGRGEIWFCSSKGDERYFSFGIPVHLKNQISKGRARDYVYHAIKASIKFAEIERFVSIARMLANYGIWDDEAVVFELRMLFSAEPEQMKRKINALQSVVSVLKLHNETPYADLSYGEGNEND